MIFVLSEPVLPQAEPAMARSTLEGMSLDDLWGLHKRVVSILEQRLDREKQKLEHQIEELGRKFGGAPSDIPQRRPEPEVARRRPYPRVPQKYCNPEHPAQTWSGRGKQPRWVKTLMADGATLEDLHVDGAELVRAWLNRAGT
jgi:DNA-binding protein H-NS